MTEEPSGHLSEKPIQVLDKPTWRPRYSGPGKCGVCVCGHPVEDHHCGVVCNPAYYAQTGEELVPQECEFYGCNEDGGLDDKGELHCGHYVDAGDTSEECVDVRTEQRQVQPE
jgi:hypothetical protein